MMWYFYDATGSKQGPITAAQLKGLASQGILGGDTIIEDENGKQSKAEKVQGLEFPSPPIEATSEMPNKDSDEIAKRLDAMLSIMRQFNERDRDFKKAVYKYMEISVNTYWCVRIMFWAWIMGIAISLFVLIMKLFN